MSPKDPEKLAEQNPTTTSGSEKRSKPHCARQTIRRQNGFRMMSPCKNCMIFAPKSKRASHHARKN